MDTRQLEVFVAVAEEHSFTRAARRLFAAQSTISAAVRALELELGAPLFERSTRSVALTGLGETVLVDARAALDAIDRMRTTASPGPEGLRGHVRMGVFSSLGMSALPAALGRFHDEHPLVRIALVASPAGSTGLLDDVRHGRLDAALVALSEAELAGLDPVPLERADYLAILPVRHPLASAASLRLEQLADEPFVDTPAGFGNRVILDQALRDAGMQREVVAEVADLPSVVDYVEAGLGVAILPALVRLSAGVVGVPVPEVPAWRCAVVSSPAARRTPAVRALLELLREAGAASAQTAPR